MADIRKCAVVIGVGKFTSDYYSGKRIDPIPQATNDARAVAKFFHEQQGITIVGPLLRGKRTEGPFLNEKATVHGVREAIREAQKKIGKNGLLVLYFSGHGSTIETPRNISRIEPTWLLFDKYFQESEWYALMATFGADQRIFMIDDSCSSASFGPPESLDKLALEQEVHAGHPRDLVPRRGRSELKSRALPKSVRQQIWNDRRDELQTVQAAFHGTNRIRASVTLLAACQANQDAFSGKRNGVFTRVLLEVLRRKDFEEPLSYRDLFRVVHRHRAFNDSVRHQSPFFWTYGPPKNNFSHTRLFSVAGEHMPGRGNAPERAASRST